MTGVSKSPTQDYNYPIIVGGLVVGVFFGGVGGGVAFPTLPTLGSVLGIAPFVVGIILSANRFSRLIMNAPAGQIIDKFGARKPIILGLFIQGAAPFGYILGLNSEYVPVLEAAEIFLIARLLWGIGSAFVFVGAFSIIIDITTEDNRGKWVGYFQGGNALGFPSGLVLGGILTDFYGYTVAFATAGTVEVFAAAVATLIIPKISPENTNPARLQELPRLVKADPRILLIGSVNTCIYFLYAGILMSTIVLYAEAHSISFGAFSAIGMSGIFLAITVVASAATTLVSGRLSDYAENRTLVVIPALLMMALGFVVLSTVPTPLATILGGILIGIGNGGTSPPMLAYLGDISPEDDIGKIGGVFNIFGDIGSTLGPVVALPVAALLGYQTEYILCSGLLLIVLVFVIQPLLDDPNPQQQLTAAIDD